MAGVYDKLITRVDAAGFIPEPTVVEIQTEVERTSIAMTMFRKLPMSSAQAKMAVLDALPYAYWVNGDTGLKQTTKVSWSGKLLTAEEIAVIVPIPQAVLDDTSVDLWAQVRPLLAGAFADKLDQATVFGVDRPASFAQAIVPGATAAGQAYTDPDPLVALDEALAGLEASDTNVGDIVARATLRGAIRKALAALGGAASFSAAPNTLYGYDLMYPKGTLAWPAALQAIVGDYNAAILGVRQDITYKLLDQSVISDDTGKVVFNLPQQDSVALRAVARYAFQVADTLHIDNAGALVKGYPFATAAVGA
jgi:HK97 family phage major capsid protein